MAGTMSETNRWTDRDSILYATCEIAVAAAANRLHERPALAHAFALQFSPDERLLASGSYSLAWWGAVGDGTYQSRTTIVGGTGILGIGLLGATALGSAIGNANRRARAAADASNAWRPYDEGMIHVSDRGFYLHGPGGFRAFAWSHVVMADVPYQTVLQFAAHTSNGTDQFWLTSDWAELLFVLWALTSNRNHPRLVGDGWIDHGFFDKCRQHDYPAPTPGLGR